MDDQLLTEMKKKVDDIHELLFPPPRPPRAERLPGEAALIVRVREELAHRRRATTTELAEALSAKKETVRVSLYALRRRGQCARIGRGLWASAWEEKSAP